MPDLKLTQLITRLFTNDTQNIIGSMDQSWLYECDKRNAVFCFLCLLFGEKMCVCCLLNITSYNTFAYCDNEYSL